MPTINVLITYEHIVRELDSICLLRAELLRRGYCVYVMNIYETNLIKRIKFLLFKRLSIIVVPTLRDCWHFRFQVNRLVGATPKVVVNLQWEQVFSPANEEEQLAKGLSTRAVHCCWGERIRDKLLNRGIPKALLTGPVQLDLLRGDLPNNSQESIDLFGCYGVNNKKVVLFTSSFSIGDFSDYQIDALAKECNYDARKLQTIERKSKKIILSWFADVLTERKELTIIYRPHPSEVIDDDIRRMAENHANFRVIGSEPVNLWIKCCDATLTWISTSIVNNYIMNKPSLILQPVDVGEFNPYIFCNANKCMSYERFLEFLDNPSSSSFPISSDEFKDFYYVSDSTFSFIRTADVLDSLMNEQKDLGQPSENRQAYPLGYVLIEIFKIILVQLKVARLIGFMPNSKFKEIFKIYIERRQNAIADLVTDDEIEKRTAYFSNFLSEIPR